MKFKRSKILPNIPAVSTSVLPRDESIPSFKGDFHYRSIIGTLDFLEKITRPDIGHTTHKLVWFYEDSKAPQGKIVEYLAKYLITTRDKGIVLTSDKCKSIKVYADADFSGNWNE